MEKDASMNEEKVKQEKVNQEKANQELMQAINRSLDKSLDDIDDLNLQRLKSARAKALSVHSKPKWIALAAAASIATLLLLPIITHQFSKKSEVDTAFEVVSQEAPLSAEEMDDIDMLMALEDTDA